MQGGFPGIPTNFCPGPGEGQGYGQPNPFMEYPQQNGPGFGGNQGIGGPQQNGYGYGTGQ